MPSASHPSNAPVGPSARHLVGREAELARLHASLTDAITGAGCFVLVSGEASIGKTTLVATLEDDACGLARIIHE